jgi:molybdenum cofactor cytidylyltransferase
MGQSKQMLPIFGEPMLTRTCSIALKSKATYTVVVLGANKDLHESILKNQQVAIIQNPLWQNGMGSSLKAGLNHLLTIDAAVDAAIITVCDQPYISEDHLNALINRYLLTQKKIIASYYSESPGVPVLFDKNIFPVLLNMPDDQGAKKVITLYPKDTELINFPGGEIDLDTPDSYKSFLDKNS